MHRIVTLPLGVFDEDGTGKIRRTVNESTAATETFIAHNLPDKAAAAATPVGLLVLLGAFNWKLGLICLIPAIIGFAFMMSMMGKDMQEKMAEYQNALDTMNSETTEYVRGVPVVKVFGQSVYSFRRFKEAIDGFGKWTTDYTKILRMPMTMFMTSINSVFAFLVFGAYVLTKGSVDADMILNVMYYIIMTPLLTVTLTKIAYSGEQEMVVLDALKRMDNILSIRPLDEAQKKEFPKDNSIVFRNVSYRYNDSADFAVKDLNIQVESGEHIALVGPSGGGKTTAAELLARFFDVTEGSIFIGGADIRNIPQDTLMKQISFVFQDSRLLKTSILENVRLARPDASEAEVMKALETAQCMDIIEKLPDSVHTVIGAKGTYLSGGERQRISIARAFLKDAPIILLDEATASLDVENETKVQSALTRLIKDKTVMVIAHRMRTVAKANKIVVLDQGCVAEQGSPEQLMKKDGVFANMVRLQTQGQDWSIA